MAERSLSSLSIPPHHVLEILLILVAKILHEFRVGSQMMVLFEGPGLGVDLGVVDGVLDLQMSKIATPEAFDDVETVAVRAAAGKNRVTGIEASCVDDQRVAVPSSDGIPPPCGVWLFR